MIWGKTNKQRDKDDIKAEEDAIDENGTNCFVVLPTALEDGKWIWWQRAFFVHDPFTLCGRAYYINQDDYLKNEKGDR